MLYFLCKLQNNVPRLLSVLLQAAPIAIELSVSTVYVIV